MRFVVAVDDVIRVTVLPVSPLLRRPTSNMPPKFPLGDLSKVAKPDDRTGLEKKCEACSMTIPAAGSRYCSSCGTFWADLQTYMYHHRLDEQAANQFRAFGDLEEFRVRAIGQWDRSQSHDEFARMMELVMLEFQTKGFHAQKQDKKKDGKKGKKKGKKKDEQEDEKKDEQEDEKKDEQEDEDSEDSEDMNDWQASSPLVIVTAGRHGSSAV